MARWKLTEPHYLNVPTERWEQVSTDPNTGKPVRKLFKVPKHLDPRVEDDWNVKFPGNSMDGEIHVCHEGKDDRANYPKEPAIIFEGNPTPGMVPLDDEAKEISGRFSWTPTQGIDEESQRASFYSKLGDTLVDQMSELRAAQAMAPQNAGIEKLLEVMTAMMQQNQQIMQAFLEKSIKEANPMMTMHPDQAVDEEEPLPDTAPTEEELAESIAAAEAKDYASLKKAEKHVSGRRL